MFNLLRVSGMTTQDILIQTQKQVVMKIEQAKPDRKSLPSRGLKSNTQVWMDQKRQRDAELWGCDTSNYWIVENKLYDLSSYMDRHPGGKRWLQLTRGQDVTELFIIHHLNQNKVREVLSKFYVEDTKNKIERYSFEEDGLYRNVKRQMLKEMSVAQIQDETKSKIYAFILLGLLVVFLGLTVFSIDEQKASYLPYVFGACCSVLLIGMIGIGHNFVHHKDNPFKYFFALTGFTHNEWQVMHAMSHHIYPNLELDYEAAALEPLGFFLRSRPENKVYTEILIGLSFIFIQPLNFVLKTILVPIIKRRKPELWYLVPLVVILSIYLRTGDLWYAFKHHLFIYGVFGALLNRVLFCGHRLQELWSEGAERIQDFGEHTILSTNDTDTGLTGFLSLLLVAGFNIHTPHHFFPTADHSALPKILTILDRECRKKGITRFETNRVGCLISLSKGIINRVPFVRK